MDEIWDKLGVIIAALITAMGGLYMYDRKTNHERLTKAEQELAALKTDVKVIETRFHELKEDTEEIKESQKAIISLLTKRKR